MNETPATSDRLAAESAVTKSTLEVAVIAQIAAFLLGLAAAIGFLTNTVKGQTELKPGMAPLTISFVVLWMVLLAGVAVGRRRTAEPLFGRGPWLKPTDPLWFLGGVALQFVAGLLYRFLPIDTKTVGDPAKELYDRTGDKALNIVLLAVCVAVLAPLVEELFYRGLVLNALDQFRQRQGIPGGAWGPILASAVWFGAIHFQFLQFPALFLVGVACAAARWRTGRLQPAILTHIGFNLTTVVALIATKGSP